MSCNPQSACFLGSPLELSVPPEPSRALRSFLGPPLELWGPPGALQSPSELSGALWGPPGALQSPSEPSGALWAPPERSPE
eukprot:2894144-Alexandrium_andersonii.AAC.1